MTLSKLQVPEQQQGLLASPAPVGLPDSTLLSDLKKVNPAQINAQFIEGYAQAKGLLKQETELNIGNGSEVEVAFNVFTFKKIKGNGADLAGIRITKLVPYTTDVKDVFDFDEQPDQVSEENPFK